MYILTAHHGVVLRIVNDPDLAVELQRFAERAANVLGQLPEGAALLEMIAREIERRQHLVDASFVRLQTEHDHFGGMLLEKATNRTWIASVESGGQ